MDVAFIYMSKPLNVCRTGSVRYIEYVYMGTDHMGHVPALPARIRADIQLLAHSKCMTCEQEKRVTTSPSRNVSKQMLHSLKPVLTLL